MFFDNSQLYMVQKDVTTNEAFTVELYFLTGVVVTVPCESDIKKVNRIYDECVKAIKERTSLDLFASGDSLKNQHTATQCEH